MVCRGCLIVALLLTTVPASAEEKTWTLRGRVVDEQNKPVADVAISNSWTANGVTLEQLEKFQKEGGDATPFSINEGRMEPWGLHPTKSDAGGNFSFEMGWTDYKLLAIDKERKRGALIVVDPHNAPSHVDVKLAPLVRLHGRVRIAATGKDTTDMTVVVGLPLNEKFPLGGDRLAMCSSVKSRFEFLLPPGDYHFEVFGHKPPRHELPEFQTVKLPAGVREFDAGVLELTPAPPPLRERLDAAQPNGKWVDVDLKKLYGQPLPKWHAVDARGVAKDAQISDFKGKWVLVYLWGPWCAPCLGKTLPALTEFYESHKAHRDRFEIVSICLDPDGKLKSMADLDRHLKPIVKAEWNGKELPFPVLLDNTIKTQENFGLEAVGTLLVVDPTGRVVPGDENTLAEKLKETSPADPKR